MTMVAVDSSMLLSAGYDDAAGEMEVVFRSGAVWRYEVPKKVYLDLLKASSIGQYMNSQVIDCYPCYEVSHRRRR